MSNLDQKNNLGIGKIPAPPRNMDPSQGEPVKCPKCEGVDLKVEILYNMFRFSRFRTGDPEDTFGVIPKQVYKCASCGEVITLPE